MEDFSRSDGGIDGAAALATSARSAVDDSSSSLATRETAVTVEKAPEGAREGAWVLAGAEGAVVAEKKEVVEGESEMPEEAENEAATELIRDRFEKGSAESGSSTPCQIRIG